MIEIYRVTIKSITLQSCKDITTCLTSGGHFGTIQDLVVKAVEEVLQYERLCRANRECNVPERTDLIAERRDEQGRRRYRLGAVDDSPVMVPDSDGYWTPVAG